MCLCVCGKTEEIVLERLRCFMDRMRWRLCAHGGKGRVDGGIGEGGHTAARDGSMLEKSRSYESSKVYTWQQKDGWPPEMFSSFTNQKCC